MQIAKNWSLNKEIYAVADPNDRYVALIIAIYENSQFHIVFNERQYLSQPPTDSLTFLMTKGQLLQKLVAKAKHELNLDITNISYNLSVDQIQIIPHTYYYQFPKPTVLTPAKLKEVNTKFLKDYDQNSEYQNFLFRINRYSLLDQKEMTSKPPYGKVVGSIKVSGYLYQVKWRQLYEYVQIFKTAGVNQFCPIMLPYAIHVNLNFLERTKNSILVWWSNEVCQIFVFSDKIFTQYLTLRKAIKIPIEQISETLNQDFDDIKSYVYNLLNLNDDRIFEQFKLINSLEEQGLQRVRKSIAQTMFNFIAQTIKEIEFIVEEKFKLISETNTIFVLGEITAISGFEQYLKTITTKYQWKVHNNHFVGLKDSNDLFLIGNAYYQHLQRKLLYNHKSTGATGTTSSLTDIH